MASNFNTYNENIDSDFWRNSCVEKEVFFMRHALFIVSIKR